MPFLFVSLATFAFAPYLKLTDPKIAYILFFGSVGGAILGAQQIFIDNLFSGKRLLGIWYKLCFGAFLLAVGLISWILPISFFALMALFTYLLFFCGTGLYRTIFAIKKTPIAIATLFGALWFIAGCITVIINPSLVDFAFHMWTIGWALPLVIAVSIHIMRFMS